MRVVGDSGAETFCEIIGSNFACKAEQPIVSKNHITQRMRMCDIKVNGESIARRKLNG